MVLRFKFISMILIVGLLCSSIPVAAQTTVTPVTVLADLEEVLYGAPQEGSLLFRLEQVEFEIFGSPQSGPVLNRIQRARNYLDSNASGSNLKAQLNLAEWGFLAKITDGEPLRQRLANIETELFGVPQEGPVTERIEQLMMFIWGTTELDSVAVEVKEQSLIKIRLLTTLDSSANQVGDIVRYRVVEDLMVDGRVVVPKGAEGFGRVTEVVTAGSVGRDGRVVIDFGAVPALDGSGIPIRISERATEKNRSLELAAGASMAGLMLLGSPVGLVGGYFVKGKDVQIPVGTEFYVETARTTQVLGFSLVPVY